jgi:hypothetical protein
MSRARFESATPATKRQQTYALDSAATGIGYHLRYQSIILHFARLYFWVSYNSQNKQRL